MPLLIKKKRRKGEEKDPQCVDPIRTLLDLLLFEAAFAQISFHEEHEELWLLRKQTRKVSSQWRKTNVNVSCRLIFYFFFRVNYNFSP